MTFFQKKFSRKISNSQRNSFQEKNKSLTYEIIYHYEFKEEIRG